MALKCLLKVAQQVRQGDGPIDLSNMPEGDWRSFMEAMDAIVLFAVDELLDGKGPESGGLGNNLDCPGKVESRH